MIIEELLCNKDINLASRVHKFMSIWWNGGNQLISSPAVMKCVVQAAPSLSRQCAVSWCPLPVPSPRAFSAPQPPHSTLSWPQRAQAHRPAVSWLSLNTPVTLTQGPDFQQDQDSSEKCFRDVPCFNLIAFGYSFFIDIFSFSDREQLVTFDDVNWLRRFQMSGTETTTMWWTETLW